MSTQSELFPPSYGTTRPDRLETGTPERIYYERWLKENKQVPGLNGGYGLLEHLLSTKPGIVAMVSDRDSVVAASVVQWLGTNCGRGFIYECEREISAARELERIFRTDWGSSWRVGEKDFSEIARLISGKVRGHRMQGEVAKSIARALESAYEMGRASSFPIYEREGIQRGISLRWGRQD